MVTSGQLGTDASSPSVDAVVVQAGRPPNAPLFLSDRLEQRERPLRAQDRPQCSRYHVRIPEGHRRRATVPNRRASGNRSGLRPHKSIVLDNLFRVKVARDRKVDEASRRRPLAARAAPKVRRSVPRRRYRAKSGTTALRLGPSAASLACCAPIRRPRIRKSPRTEADDGTRQTGQLGKLNGDHKQWAGSESSSSVESEN